MVPALADEPRVSRSLPRAAARLSVGDRVPRPELARGRARGADVRVPARARPLVRLGRRAAGPGGGGGAVPPVAETTSDELAVVRFHGRNLAAWDRPGVGTVEKFGYRYTLDELSEGRPRVHRLPRPPP